MNSTHTRITKEILQNTIAGENYVVQDFFVGVTDNPRRRLFSEHKVDKDEGLYVYFEAGSKQEANEAYNELLFKMDMNGTAVSNDKDGKYVYCYHIDGNTIECPSSSEIN